MTREEAIEANKNLLEYMKITNKQEPDCQFSKDNISALEMAIKSLAQEPNIGHWIEEKDDYGKVMCWHCDNCYEDSGFFTTCAWDFCPNCGAKMIEPNERSEKE